MTVEIKPEQRALIQRQLDTGHFQSTDEIVATALACMPYKQGATSGAVARMIEFSRSNSVKLPPSEMVDQLIEEGHRY